MRRSACDSGFSLIEVIIAMFVLALMAMGLIPLMIGAMQSSVTNRAMAAASAFATAQIAEVQSAFGNDSPRLCSELASYEHDALPDDPTHPTLLATREALDSCGTDEYSTVTVRVSVASADEAARDLVTLTTKVLVAKG
ncbi:MAG: type II secretion system GspH family protein [Actinobacteria bacterium]|nr:type II secretion system GspH family protein [Actinomycetota bacterium]